MDQIPLAAARHRASKEEQTRAKQETALEAPYNVSCPLFVLLHDNGYEALHLLSGGCIVTSRRCIDMGWFPDGELAPDPPYP